MTERNADLSRQLRRGDPADAARDSVRDTALGERMKSSVLAAERIRPGPHSRRFLVPALAATALIAVAAATVLTRSPSDPRGISCYGAASLDAPVVVVATPASLTPDACEPVWLDGTLSGSDESPAGTVPTLVACVNDAGGLAVFPGQDPQLCRELGLADYEQPPIDDALDLNRELVELFSSKTCLPIGNAAAQIEDLLARTDAADWSIDASTPATTQRPCASFSLDAPQHRVIIVPIPRPGGS